MLKLKLQQKFDAYNGRLATREREQQQGNLFIYEFIPKVKTQFEFTFAKLFIKELYFVAFVAFFAGSGRVHR